ncbi:PREDICTED: aldehyde dehydrogenase family 8 member A1 isoform X2 [Rhinopithecus bieti]|uniref:aldehyde dehydrogenase family 8 member A1 isoform X2 n=1 Tax=Rhinopithecus bieti TaxID=61621 RepID=UPI00083BCFF2|nr:PREDICTED: aldehyde dehydrogenase family 8 member A1 isoform X2 [Rhinopithecus bieti]
MAGTKALLMLENFIDGKFLPCSSYIDSYDPSTGEVYCRVPNSGKDEIEAAVKAAREAFPGWSSHSPQERSRVLNQVADLLEQSLEEFAQAESKDQGKTLALARTMDIPRSVQNFRFFASSILHHTSECTQMDHLGCMHYTVRTPVGVAGLISPWNLPLYLLTWKIAPAMAAGNTVVAKPSELTSVTAWMLCTLLDKAGVPPGVVNIVFGTGPRVGEALVSHPEVPLISFTGSQPTAERITQLSAPHCKKLSLELGGKNPAIIFEDANLDECIPATVRSSFANQVYPESHHFSSASVPASSLFGGSGPLEEPVELSGSFSLLCISVDASLVSTTYTHLDFWNILLTPLLCSYTCFLPSCFPTAAGMSMLKCKSDRIILMLKTFPHFFMILRIKHNLFMNLQDCTIEPC